MAATSPYSQNDYAAVSNFRPYELPINDIYKGISAQNQFWDAGAARINTVRDNALNLKLSLEPNKELRKKYMEDADKQLTKLSTMDVSKPSVQREGFSLFKPLFQDEGVVYDDLTTRHYEKVRNDAMMYRSKDNGKEYSDINMQYAMQGYSEFLNSKDRTAGKKFYENRKEYTPFYDYTEDFSKALKECKPSSYQGTSPQYGSKGEITGYMKESSLKTLSAGQVKGCLEAGLTPKAARQLQIEGAVNYKNYPDVLASDTVTYLAGVNDNYSNQLQELAAQKHTLFQRKDLSDADKAKISTALDEQMKGISNEIDKTTHSMTKLSAGDYTDLLNNFESYAGSIHTYKKVYKKALASAFEERAENYKGDPIQLNAIKFEQDKTLRAIDFNYDVSLEGMKQQHDERMKMLDYMYGGSKEGKSTGTGSDVYRNPLTGEVTINPDLMRESANLTGDPVKNDKVYEDITKQVSDLNQKDTENNTELFNELIGRAERDIPFRETLLKGFNFGITDDEWTRFKTKASGNKFVTSDNKRIGIHETSWFKAYSSQKPDDQSINSWAEKKTQVQTGIAILNRKIEIGEKEVQKRLGTSVEPQKMLEQELGKINPITIDNQVITPKDIYDLSRGQSSKIKVEKNAAGSYQESTSAFIINGKKYRKYGDQSKLMNNKEAEDFQTILRLYNKTLSNINSTSSKVANTRADVYNEMGFDREPWFFTDPAEKSRLVDVLKSIIPKGSDGKDSNIRVLASDFSGGVKVSIPDASEDTLEAIRKAGLGSKVELGDNGVVIIRGTTHNVIPQAIDNPVLKQAAYQLATIAETRSFRETEVGAKVKDSDITIPVLISGKMTNIVIETYKKNGAPEYRGFIEGAKVYTPSLVATNTYELFEKLAGMRATVKMPQ